MRAAREQTGTEQVCWQHFAEALEVVPTTLAENAGLNSIRVVTELRNRHENGEKSAGVSVRRGAVTNIIEENVLQPLLVSTSAIELAAETVKMILRIGEDTTRCILVSFANHMRQMILLFLARIFGCNSTGCFCFALYLTRSILVRR